MDPRLPDDAIARDRRSSSVALSLRENAQSRCKVMHIMLKSDPDARAGAMDTRQAEEIPTLDIRTLCGASCLHAIRRNPHSATCGSKGSSG